MSLAGVADPAGGLRGGRSEAVLAGAPVRGPWGHPHLHAWPGGHRGGCLVMTVMNRCILCVRIQCLMVTVTSGDLRPDCGTSGRTGECARLGCAAHLLPAAFRPPGQNLPEGAAARTSVLGPHLGVLLGSHKGGHERVGVTFLAGVGHAASSGSGALCYLKVNSFPSPYILARL